MKFTSALKLLLIFTLLLQVNSLFAKDKKQTADPIEQELKFKVGDEKGNDIKALKTELLVQKTEKRALNQLQMLLDKHKGRKLEPDILYRLGELYMRRARNERFFEINRNNQDIMNFLPKVVNDMSEKGEIKKAIAIYDDMQKRFPSYRNLDSVIFNEAYAEQQLANDSQAERLYIKLTKNFPDSDLIPDTYLSIGEINYSHKNFANALENFKQIRKYPESRVYPYSIYKGAWCFYNMQNAKSGMKELEEVISYGALVAKLISDPQVEVKPDAKLDLRKEALNDLSFFYEEVADSKSAVDYLISQARELDPSPYIVRLSELYDRHARYKDVDQILLAFIKKIPNSESKPTARDHLIWNYEHMKMRSEAVEQMLAMNEECKAQAEHSDCKEKLTDDTKKLAQRWHALWKKNQKENNLVKPAEESYKIYLANAFTEDLEQHQMRYNYGDILFQQEKFTEASAAYNQVNQFRTRAGFEKKLGHDSAYAAIVSLEKATKNKYSDQDEKRFNELAQVYLSLYKDGEYAVDIEFKKYFIAYEKSRYEEAAYGFKKMGWGTEYKKLNPDKISKAQDLYLDILNIQKNYKELKESAQSLLKLALNDERKSHITKIYRESYFAEIQVAEEKGDNKFAIDSYKKFAKEQMQSELAPKAWWNASQLEFKIGDIQAGAETCSEMIKLFSQSPLSKECLFKSAASYESLARVDLAADVLLRLAEVDKAQENKWKEIAADFMAISQNSKKAKEIYKSLAEKRKDSNEKLQLLEKMLELDRIEHNDKSYLANMNYIIGLGIEPATSRYQIELAEKQFDEYKKDNNLSQLFSLTKKIVSKDQLPRNILARARYLQALILDDEFKRQSVKSKVEKLASVLAIKTEKLDKAQKAYQSVMAYNDPETSVKALYMLSTCYSHYSQALKNMQVSGEVSDADKEALKRELETLYLPMEDKGIDTLNQALVAAQKLHLQDGTIIQLQSELNKLNLKQQSLPTQKINQPVIYIPKRILKFGGFATIGGF